MFAILVGYHVNGLKNSTTGAFNLNSVNVVEHDCHLPDFLFSAYLKVLTNRQK